MDMNNIQSGYWTVSNNRFIRCYSTVEDARAHIAYQKANGSTSSWRIVYVKLQITDVD